jgi:hypothetical protein
MVRKAAYVEANACKSTLPDYLRRYFWDYAFDDLDISRHRDFVISRILSEGDWDAVTWLRRNVGDSGLQAWIERRQGRGLSPQQLRYWELILKLPSADVDHWLADRKCAGWDDRVSR